MTIKFEPNLPPAFDLTGFTYDNVSFQPDSNFAANGLAFTSDGTRMYVANSFQDRITEYEITTPWDLTTASFNFQFNTNWGFNSLYMSPDNTFLFAGDPGLDYIRRYTLSTPGDISTASLTASASVGSIDGNIRGLFLKEDDGLRIFFIGGSNDAVFQYNLNTPWTPFVSSPTVTSFNVGTDQGLFFAPDGTRMFTGAAGIIQQYTLSTPWDVTTAVSDNITLDASTQAPSGNYFYISPDASKLFVHQGGGGRVYQYSK